jgi:quercetin dioxygenase-like cupin family protein
MNRDSRDQPPPHDEMKDETCNGQEGFDTRCLEHLAGSVGPAVLGAEAQQRLWMRIRERVAVPALEGTRTVRAEEAEWIALSPLVRFRRLHVDAEAGYQTVLVRADPGGSIPRHRHSKDEEFIVLEGECYIGSHHLRAGDANFASAGSWHDDLTTTTGVLVLVRGEYVASARV